jgi:hypothetical protein
MTTPAEQPTVPADLSAFGRWCNGSLRLFNANAQVWLLQGLVLMGVTAVLSAAAVVPLLALPVGALLRHPGTLPALSSATAVKSLLILVACLVPLLLCLVWLTEGMTHTALKQLRGEAISVGDLFRGRRFFPVYVTLVVVSLLSTLGCSCCCIPGVVIGGAFMTAVPAAADGKGPFRALGFSWALGRQNIMLFSLYYLILVVAALLGATLLVPMVFTQPFFCIGQAVAYYDLVYGLPESAGVATERAWADTSHLPAPPPYAPPPEE